MSEFFKFDREKIEEDSDNESVVSDIEEDHILDDWRKVSNEFSDFEIVQYTLGKTHEGLYENTSEFVNTILSEYNNSKYITSIRLIADIHNPDDPSDTRYGQNTKIRDKKNSKTSKN